jgi:hypothetical protein
MAVTPMRSIMNICRGVASAVEVLFDPPDLSNSTVPQLGHEGIIIRNLLTVKSRSQKKS